MKAPPRSAQNRCKSVLPKALAALMAVVAGSCSEENAAVSADGGGGKAPIDSGSAGQSDAVAGDASAVDAPASARRILLFSKTLGFRHDSIPAAIHSLDARASARRWQVTATEDASWFDDARLDGFDVVVFLLTSGDVLDEFQQAAFERYIGKGRGWVGVHSASDTEYGWPWYGELVGAYFAAHPPIQEARLRVERPSQLSMRGLPAVWQRTDEWYSFSRNPRSNVNVLLSLDETSYAAGETAMGDHPVAWYHGHDGGRAFYTALGHTIESWSEPSFLDHVTGAIDWAAGSEAESSVLVEFDGVAESGDWDIHQFAGSFPYSVTRERLFMTDLGGQNQHLTRRGIAVDPNRPYAVEGLFTLLGPGQGLDSFCFNLNLGGADGDLSRIDTWSINVDALGGPPNGTMKHMGFVNGAFSQIGEHPAPWARKDVEYLLRVEVNRGAAGDQRPKAVTATVFESGIELQRFEVDYSVHPYQPDPGRPVRIGANTHGTDWALRSLRVYYTDQR
jgi:type 1 glutamine amidotransferase